MCERGTEVALFDYADGAESVLGYSSWVLYDADNERNFDGCIGRFAARFGDRVVGLHGFSKVDGFLATHPEILHLYMIKCDNDRQVAKQPNVRTYVHAVFDAGDPYGDVYARISPCVPTQRNDGSTSSVPVVPHIVRRQEASGSDLRAEYGIPPDATVFGRYGGYESFDIDAAREAVLEIARAQSGPNAAASDTGGVADGGCVDGRCTTPIYFIFMNTPPLGEPLPHIIHVAKSSDASRKSAFIRTCDAMLHARSMGETFGLAVGEFSAHNRPVITSSAHHDDGNARFHLDTLGSKGLYYHDTPSLLTLLRSFDRLAARRKDWNAYRQFEPGPVMQTFDKVFIRGKPRRDVPDWKRWKHGGGGRSAGAMGGGGVSSRGRPTKEQMADFHREHERMRRVHDELGRLRGLPAVPEEACDGRYRVLCAQAALRLAPSTSAATVGAPLLRGATCRVVATRGEWVRLAEPCAEQSEPEPDAATQPLPRWMLTHHPEDGLLAEPDP